MSREARGRLAFALLALGSLACATAATTSFVRPTGGPGRIVDVATGRAFTDCRTAFAEATGETILRFSAGVFDCGPELQVASDNLVVRGAGLGHTFLVDGRAKLGLRLTVLDPGRELRVEDLAFGGLGAQPTQDSEATIVRCAVATARPMLFGTSDGVQGSVVVIHSVLAKSTRPLLPTDSSPEPIAYDGNEHVALIESVLSDVEQEFERYPAPGSIELLDGAMQAAFAAHEPAAGHRRDPSTLPNVSCGSSADPQLVCLGSPERVTGETPIARAAKLFVTHAPLEDLEAPLREAGRDFARRFHQTLGNALRQPDVFWFGDSQASLVASESQLSGRAADAQLVRARAPEALRRCADPTSRMRDVLACARALDRLLPHPAIAAACVKDLRPRAVALLDRCRASFDWTGVLQQVADLDSALGDHGASVVACKEKLRARALSLARAGPLARAYLGEVDRVLGLGANLGAGAPASLASISQSLPWVVTQAGVSIPLPASPSALDTLVHAALTPGSGDGRQLIDVTPECALVPVSPGSPVQKAVGDVTLAIKYPHAGPHDVPQVVLKLPVQASMDDLPPGTDAGEAGVDLVNACGAKAAQSYPEAVRQYVVQELARKAALGPAGADAEVALFLAQGAATGGQVQGPPKNVPLVPEALAALADDLSLSPAMAVGTSDQPQGPAAPPQPASTAKAPPAWSMRKLMRAADLLSRSGQVNLASCAFFLDDVPWQTQPTKISGLVLLDGVPSRLVCRSQGGAFELSVWVDGPTKNRVRILSALERALARRLGVPVSMNTGYGPGVGWAATPTERTAFVFRSVPPRSSMLGYLLVPLGSSWPHR